MVSCRVGNGMGDGDREHPGHRIKGQLEVRRGMGGGTLREEEEAEEDEGDHLARPGKVACQNASHGHHVSTCHCIRSEDTYADRFPAGFPGTGVFMIQAGGDPLHLAGSGDLSSISQEEVVSYDRDEDNDGRVGDDEGREVA
jgi:hypothetical protein